VAFPPLALAEALIRATPGDVATFFIETLGHWARRLTAIGAVIVAAFIGAEILARARSDDRLRPWPAAIVLAASGVIALILEPSSEASVLPTVAVLALATVAYVWVARSVYGRLTRHEEVDSNRRTVLRLGLTGAAGLTVAGGALGWIARKFAGPDTNVKLMSARMSESIPDDPSFPDVAGISPEVTTPARHYVVDINLIPPTVEAEGWSLPVRGEVDQPLELTFQALQSDFEVIQEYAVLTCVSNEVGGPLVGHSLWGGVRLRDVLERAGVRDSARDVVFTAADGYSDSIPVEAAMDPAVLLAVSQNGRPLTQEHGFPCRVRIPAIYGMKNAKWLVGIEVVRGDYKGYWQQRGWSDTAIVQTESRIDVPDGGANIVRGERQWIAGVAWAGDRGISMVEVSTDGGGTWQETQLKETSGNDSWRLWAYEWTPTEAGGATLQCRATDGEGEVQTDRRADPHPSGATGYHSVDVSVT
jgi:DMSO/TMAO reductase YedYZ molybdopterin-dependent catalytic subunit